MSDVLKPIDVSIEKDGSGGVRVRIGGSLAVMSPEQAFDFALAVLKVAGVGVEFGGQFQRPVVRHFG